MLTLDRVVKDSNELRSEYSKMKEEGMPEEKKYKVVVKDGKKYIVAE